MEPIRDRGTIVRPIVVAFVLFAAWSPWSRPADASARSVADLLPPDATRVIAIDIDDFVDAGVLREVLGTVTSISGGAEPFQRVEAFGVAVETDLEALYLVTTDSGREAIGSVILAEGEFGAVRARLVEDPGITSTEYDGHRVFRDRAGRALGLVDDVAVFGAVASVLEHASSEREPPPVAGLLAQVDPSFAVRIAHVLSASDHKANPLLATLESVRGGIDVSAGLRLHLDVRSQDANGSRLLSQVVRATADAYARTPAMQEVGLAPVFARVRVEDRDREFTIALELDADEFAALRRALANLVEAYD